MTPRGRKPKDPDTLAERNLKREVDDLVGHAKDLLTDLEIKAQDAENTAAQCRAQAQRIRDLLGSEAPQGKRRGRKKGTTRKKATRSARKAATAPTARKSKEPTGMAKVAIEAVMAALADPARPNNGRTVPGIQGYLSIESTDHEMNLSAEQVKKILEILKAKGLIHHEDGLWIRNDYVPPEEKTEKKTTYRKIKGRNHYVGGSKPTRPPLSGSPGERKAIIDYLKFLDLRDHGASAEDIQSRMTDTCNAWTLDLSQTLQVLEGMMDKKVVRLDRETSKWHIVKNTGNSQAQKDDNMETS